MGRLKNRFFQMKVLKIQTSYTSIIGNTWNKSYKIIYIIHLEDRFAQKEVMAAKAAHGLLISSAAPSPSVFFVNGTVTHLHMKS